MKIIKLLESKKIKESISSVEPIVKFQGKSSHTFTKDKKWEVDFDEAGNIVARTRHGKPSYFKGHINDKVNDFPSSDEDNIILAAREQHGLKFGNKEVEEGKNKKTEDIDYSKFRNMPDLIPYTPVEDNKKWQYSVGGVDVPYTSYEEAKAHLKDDYKITDYRNELQEYIDKETGRPHTFFVDETFDGRLCIDINHGDWKHEHWYADSLVKKFFMNKGLGIEIEEDVTLEDGSDTYSACHYYEIDDIMLSGRVVEESLKEDLTDPSEVIEFKKQLSIVDNLDDIQELITGLSDGVAEDLVQQAFDANEMRSIGEVKSAVLSALDVYLEDNDWLGESLEEDMNGAAECKARFYQVFEAPKSPKENGKMIGQRGTLKDAIAFGDKRTGGRNNFLVKAVCNDGTKKYVDFNLMSDDEISRIDEGLWDDIKTVGKAVGKATGGLIKSGANTLKNKIQNSNNYQKGKQLVNKVKDSSSYKEVKNAVQSTDTYKKQKFKDELKPVLKAYQDVIKGVEDPEALKIVAQIFLDDAKTLNAYGIQNDIENLMKKKSKEIELKTRNNANNAQTESLDESIIRSELRKKIDEKIKVYENYIPKWTSAVTESIGEKRDIFCVDCDTVTTQTYKGTFKDGAKTLGRYICDRCGCENDNDPINAELTEASEGFEKEFYNNFVILKNRASDGWDIYSYEGTPEKVTKVYLEDEGCATLQAAKDEIDKWHEEAKLDEASYGGAFDIADDEYFTRDDIETASEKVLDHVNETFSEEYVLGGTWFENGNWIVNIQTQDGMEEYEVKVPVSMRRIRKPSDIEKYVLEVASKLIAQIKEYNGLDEAFSGEYSDKFYKLAKDFEVDDDVQGLRVLADDVIRYCPEEDVKDCWYDRGYQKRQQDEEDRIAWLNSDDELDEDYNLVDGWEYQPAGHGSIPEYNKEYSDRLLGIIIPPTDEYVKYFAALYDNSIADYIYSDLTRFDVDDESALFDSMEAAVKYLDTEASKALNNLNIGVDDLNEDYDGESEKGPDEGADAGIADLLSTAIIDEWEAIKEYNDLAINARAEGFDDVATIIDDINTEENIHVGQLQQALTTISPNANVINQGQQEARDQLSGGSASEIEDTIELEDVDDDF